MEDKNFRSSLALSIKLRDSSSLEKISRANREAGYDLLELRADYYRGEDLLGLVSQARDLSEKPLIFTLRTREEGGQFEFSPDYYRIIEEVIRKGLVQYIDLEAGLYRKEILDLAKSQGIITIGSYHRLDSTESEADILRRLESINSLGFDLIKLAQYARSYEDALALIAAGSKYAYGNAILIGMGSYGRPTRFLDFMSGSRINFLGQDELTAPGQISLEDYQAARRLFQLNID